MQKRIQGVQDTIPPEDTRVHSTRLTTYFWLLTVIWTIVVIGLLVLDFLQIKQVQRETAETEARSNFNKDQAFRLWASKHGGVYVPINSRTPSNPFLSHIPERDITTESGKALTLMSPAHMLRQTQEVYEDLFGISGHITSLKHYRPETAPDEWEKAALAAFERGDKEILEFTEIQGTPYLRLMRPMITKKSCLKCHAKQGYKVGDVRGGVSVAVPMSFYLTNQRKMFMTHAFGLGLVWLLGIAGIGMAARGLRNRIRERDRAEAELQKAHDTLEVRVEERTAELKNEIEEHKQAELRLKESEEKYRSMMESMNDPAYICSPDFHVEYMNPAMVNRTGRDATGEPCYKAINEFDEKCPWCVLDKVQEDESCVTEITSPKDNRIYSVSHSPIHHVDGSISKLTVYRDITRIKNMEQQLSQAQKIEAIATLAGGMAHNFNNALTPIMGNVDLLQMQHGEDEKTMKCLKDMKTSGLRMARLTSQLLAYAKGGKYNPQALSLSDFVNATLPLTRANLDPAVRVETDLPLDIMSVRADETQMQMVLSAIVANSNEAMEGPGRIRISTKNMDLDQEAIKDYPDLKPGPYVCLSVEDDGKGMDEETRNRIFDPFFTTHFMGRGLGMASVYGIIKNYDGTIIVESEEMGKGTTIRIYLPAIEAKEEIKKEEVPGPAVELAMGEGTILVIEDEESVMMIIRQILERLDYQILEAETGKKAIELAETFDGQIDLALLDIKLPDMTGDKVYPLIMAARPNLKVIVCSGYDIEGLPQGILDAGAEGFIKKPFSVAAFADKLKEVLEEK